MNAMERSNVETVRRLYEEVLHRGRLETIAELLTGDAIFHGPAEVRGPDGFGAMVQSLRASFPDLQFQFDDFIASGDRVVARWTMHATHHGAIGKFPATGKPVEQRAIVVYRLHGGKIIEGWAQMDRLGLMQQIGAFPSAIGAVRPHAAGGPTK